MKQVAHNIIMADRGFLGNCRYLIHDRDTKFCESFREIIKSGGINPLRLTARSSDLNPYSERFVLSIKSGRLSKMIFFGEQSLWKAITEYVTHYYKERNHQGRGNILLFPSSEFNPDNRTGPIRCRSRLDGMLNYYYHQAA